MKVYYDTEFLENGSTIRLISIGLIREDGKKLYRVNFDYSLMKDVFMHPWLRQNVAPYLPYTMTEDGVALIHGHEDYDTVMHKDQIAEDVKRFLIDTPNLELWAYYCSYDHVVLAQLFGRMIDLPTGIPMYTNDLRSEIQRMGNPRVPEQLGGHHNALADATWNKDTHEYLQGLQRAKESIFRPYGG